MKNLCCQAGKKEEIESLGVCFEKLVKFGILLDAEFDDVTTQIDKHEAPTIKSCDIISRKR